MNDKYIVGEGKPPKWIKATWEAYQRLDGKVGYVITHKGMQWPVTAGDRIYKTPQGIRIDVDTMDGFWRGW